MPPPPPPTPYTPNNSAVYLAAFNGTFAALSEAGVVNAPLLADAFSQELDTQWGSATATVLEINEIDSQSYNYWEGRSPPPIRTVFGVMIGFIPTTYTAVVAGIIALVKAGNARVVAQGIDPNSGGSVVATVLSVLVSQLSTTPPAESTAVLFASGYHTASDGGGGTFVWNPTDTRAANGGTIIQVVSIATGRWNRVNMNELLDVRWFGATGDGVTDDTAALQACMDAAAATALVFAVDTATGSSVTVYLSNGQYFITSTVFVPGYCEIIGENQTLVFSTGYAFALFQWQAHMGTIRNIAFGRGKHGIEFWGQRGGSNWGNPGDDTTVSIIECAFREQRGGFSIFQNFATAPTQLGNAFVKVQDCNFFTRSIFWGATETTVFDGGYATIDFDQVFQDDQGHDLAAWNSGGLLILREMEGVPALAHAGTTPSWIQSCNYVSAKNVRFGGETPGIATVRTRAAANFTYAGLALPTTVSSRLALDLQNCRMSASNTNIVEVYDNFPAMISVLDPAPTFDGFSKISQIPDTYGIWIDSTSLPISAYENLGKANSVIRLGGYGVNAIQYDPFKFRTSTDPTDPNGTEVTAVIKQYLVESDQHRTLGDQPKNNLYYADVIQLIDLGGINASNVTNTGTDTTTGYTLNKITATANGGFYQAAGFDSDGTTKWGGTLSAGLYCYSAYVKGNADNQIQFYVNGAIVGSERYTAETGGTLDGWQRVYWVFYHDGVAKTLGLGVGPLQNTKFVIVGLLMVNEGPTPAPYVRPVDVPATPTTHLATIPYIPAVYYGTVAPTTGTYNTGDRVVQTTPASGTAMGFVCTAGGAPGTWQPFAVAGPVNPAYPLLAPNGTIGAPSYSWSAETNSGWYRVTTGQYAFSVQGSNLATWNLSRVTFLNINEFIVAAAVDIAIETTDLYLDATTIHFRDASHNEEGAYAPDTGFTPTNDNAIFWGTTAKAFSSMAAYSIATTLLGSNSASTPFDFQAQGFTGTPMTGTKTVDKTKPRINMVGTIANGDTVTLDFGGTSNGFYVIDISQLSAASGSATLAFKNGSSTVNVTIVNPTVTADLVLVALAVNNVALNV